MLDVPKTTNMVNEDDVSKAASPVVYRLVLTGGMSSFCLVVIKCTSNQNTSRMNDTNVTTMYAYTFPLNFRREKPRGFIIICCSIHIESNREYVNDKIIHSGSTKNWQFSRINNNEIVQLNIHLLRVSCHSCL